MTEASQLLTLFCGDCAKLRPHRFGYARRDGRYAVHVYRCVVCRGRHETRIKLGHVPLKGRTS